MTIYTCDICIFSTHRFSDYNRHLKTKKHRLNEIPIQQNENTNDKNIQKHPQNIQKHPQNIHKKLKMYPCNYCEETFTNFSNKRRHELHRCKDNNNVSKSIIIKHETQIKKLEREKENQIKKHEKAMEKQKKELMKQIEILLTKVGNTTINNNQTNNKSNQMHPLHTK